jgi:hypothetical protein
MSTCRVLAMACWRRCVDIDDDAQTEVELFQLDYEGYMATFGQFEGRTMGSPTRGGVGSSPSSSPAPASSESARTDSARQAPPRKSDARPRLGIPFNELQLRNTLGTGTFGRVRKRLWRAQ